MRKRTALFWSLLTAIILAQCLVIVFAVTSSGAAAEGSGGVAWVLRQVWTSIVLTAAVQSAVFLVLYLSVLRPLKFLAEDARTIPKVNPGGKIEVRSTPLLDDLAEALDTLGTALLESRRASISTASAGSQQLDEHAALLDSVLRDLTEGIIVCDEMGRILHFNASAQRIFHNSTALRIHGLLYAICARQPIEQAIEILKQERLRREAGEMTDHLRFRCSALDGSIQLACSLHLLPPGKTPSWYFVMSFEDLSGTQTELQRKQADLFSHIDSMRSPLANLRASAEGLAAYKDSDPKVRSELEAILLNEAERLASRFQVTAREVESMRESLWSRGDILSSDLLQCVASHLKEALITLTFTGHPLWVSVDANAMILLIEFLARRINGHAGVAELEIETLLGDKRTYFAFLWKGLPIPESEIARWSSSHLIPYPSLLTVADVLRQHDSELWSKPHRREGYATLVLPVPFSTQSLSAKRPYPARPLFTTRETYLEPPPVAEVATQPLSSVTYVSFDLETTGLLPAEGDRIVAVAGVVMTAQRIFIGDVFHSLVDPGRPIPESAIRVHGITNELVRGHPSADKVLSAFQAFVGDAVLVGYDTAFDMRFIRRHHPDITNPVLDVLLLSMAVHAHTPEHSLEAIARRLGIDLDKRHTALGDAFIVAQIFSRLLPRMEERGITTVGQAYEASRAVLDKQQDI